MKKGSIILSFLISVTTILLSGCGGGGGGGVAPTPSPPASLTDPCALYRDSRNAEKYPTEEYCKNKVLGRLGVSTAYSNGYTGNGVKVAVIDSGIKMDHYELTNQINPSEAVSMAGYIYNTGTSSFEWVDELSSDQIETIKIDNAGSGYTTAPTVTINGDGTGATAVALLNGDGTIKGIYMTNNGNGYTNATFTIDNNGTGGTGLTIDSYGLGGYDPTGHGSAVSGIIAGEKNQLDVNATYDGATFQGVAYNSTVLNIKVFNENEVTRTGAVERGVTYAVNNGSNIVNLSLGGTFASAFTKPEFLNAVNNDVSIVVAAGNDGLDCLPDGGGFITGKCSFPAALPWLSGNSDLLAGDGAWVVVGSVDDNNNLSSFSNKAGVTKDNYIVAPGESIYSSSNSGGYSSNMGTSFATPIVSGAMALMREKYPHLTGKQIAQIFFDTAQDLGVAGVDDVYGHGLIDVYAAFAPIGTLGITTQSTASTVNNATKQTLNGTSMAVSPASAKIASSVSLQSAVAFDDYGRDFNVDMTQTVYVDATKEFSFDNYMTFGYGNFIFGLDQLNNSAMLGYQIDKNTQVLFSYDKSFLGDNGDGVLSLSNGHTYYGAVKGTVDTDIENIHLGYEFDYAMAQATASTNSLITDIDTIHAMGGKIKVYYKNFGVGYQIPLTAVAGNVQFTVPTSRNIDGTINYTTYKETMRNNNYERRASLFYELNTGNLFSLISYEVIKNYGGMQSDELYKRVSLNMNYLF